MNQPNSLVTYLRDLCGHLSIGTPLDIDPIEEALEELQDKVGELFDQYEQSEAPEGAEAVRDYMLEAFQLLDEAIADLFTVIAHEDPTLLAGIVANVEEANDIFETISYAVAQGQQNFGSAAVG